MKHTRWASAFVLAALVWAGGTAVGIGIAHRIERMALADADHALPYATPHEVEEAGTEKQADGSDATVFLFILGRNSAVYIWLLFGLLSAGAVTFVVLLYNGIQLGFTIGFALQSGMGGGVLADLLLTHGVLELGAFFVAGAVGFQGFRLARGWLGGRRESVKALRLGLVLLFGACALTSAAAIEAFITSRLVALHMGNLL